MGLALEPLQGPGLCQPPQVEVVPPEIPMEPGDIGGDLAQKNAASEPVRIAVFHHESKSSHSGVNGQ
jgi:hypothetical protein